MTGKHTDDVRRVSRVIQGKPATDGAGVELTRMIGTAELTMLDPFLLLDAFRSDNPDDYIAGFPPHPHRGFETVTYLLAGRMRHRDSAGHEGIIKTGGVQWMTAGRGIVHSEMPEQSDGLLEGFQLWINLPAKNKMDIPAYQEFSASEIPVEQRDKDVRITVISGITSQGTAGPVVQALTEPLYLDIQLPALGSFAESLPSDHNAFVYVISGEVMLDDANGETVSLRRDQLGTLSRGSQLALTAGALPSRLLLLAGKPLNEPVVRGGPFVMNSRAEINQAIEDYTEGRLQT